MRQTAEGLVLTLFLGVPLTLWDAFWVVTSHNTVEYRRVFRSLYHLDIGTMTISGDVVDAIVVADGFVPWWVNASLFIASPEGACPDGCQQTQLPNP